MSDSINPKHYRTHPSGVECIEIAEHFGFNLGNAIKYIWRHGEKGNPVEDLEKAKSRKSNLILTRKSGDGKSR